MPVVGSVPKPRRIAPAQLEASAKGTLFSESRCSVSLRHVLQDQAHVLIGEHGSHSHVSNRRGHHSRRKLMRRLMTAPAIRAEPLFALYSRCSVFACGASKSLRGRTVMARDGIGSRKAGSCRGFRSLFRFFVLLGNRSSDQAGRHAKTAKQHPISPHCALPVGPSGTTNRYVRAMVQTFRFPAALNWRP